jgi:hypothetical protein
MKHFNITIFFLIVLGFAFGQESDLETKIKKIGVIDYFNYNYKYLDENFKINISSKDFQKAINKYEFFPNLIKTYNDSLGIVLMLEFNDWDHARMAKMRLTYTWLRLSYHLWISENETKQMAKKFGFTQPYLFKDFLSKSASRNNTYLNNFFTTLRTNLKNTAGVKDKDFRSGSIDDLMNLALNKSPERIKDFQEIKYEREHGVKPGKDVKIGVSCGKENCCQDAEKMNQ